MDPQSDPAARLKRLFDVAWRRKWTIVVATVLSAITSLVFAAMLPRVYRATTTILVTRQRIPESMVRNPVTVGIEDRLTNLRVQLSSRSHLEHVAHEFGLIPATAQETEIEAICRKLRGQITSEIDRRDFAWFRISVADADPDRAAGIANRLAALFVEENSRLRSSQAAGTLTLTESWEERYRADLRKRDEAISEFKRKNMYEPPDQLLADVELLNSAQIRASGLEGDIRTRNNRLAALRAQRQTMWAIDAEPGNGDEPLATYQRELAALRVTYTEENPLVIRKREQVAGLVRPLPPPGLPGALSSPSANAGLGTLSLRIAKLEDEVKALESDRERESTRVASYGAQIANAPRLQQELLELTRGYDQVKRQYDTAVAQRHEAERSQDLEESHKGEQFQVQDLAQAPAVPFRPNIFVLLSLLGIGIVGGLTIGAVTVAARERIVQTVWGEDEFVEGFPDLPIYGVIPSLAAGRSHE